MRWLILTILAAVNTALFAHPDAERPTEVPTKYREGVCHSNKFIWYRVAKVASTTIQNIFNSNGVPCHAKTKTKVARHPGYFRFAFVRNPWDRVVSCYCHWVVKNSTNPYYHECRGKGFEYFVDFIDAQDFNSQDLDIHLTPQVQLVPSRIDFVGRFERLNEDLPYVLRRIHLEHVKIPRRNATCHRHYSSYYNDHTQEIIARKYKEDIEAFGYEFETP